MTPDADWTWRELLKAHRDAPDSDGLSRFRLFNRAADDLARLLDDAACRTALEMARGQTAHHRPTCLQCQAPALEHFFTYMTTGAVLCAACYAGRARSEDAATGPWPVQPS